MPTVSAGVSHAVVMRQAEGCPGRPAHGRTRRYLRALTSIQRPSSNTSSIESPAFSTAPAKSPVVQMENQRLPMGVSSAHPVTPSVLTDTLTGARGFATRAISRSATAASS